MGQTGQKVLSDIDFKGKVRLPKLTDHAGYSKIVVVDQNNALRSADKPPISKVFDTLAEMTLFLTNPARYAGQIVSCKEAEGEVFILSNTMDSWILAAQQGPPGEKGDKPSHNWNHTSLRFENPDGSWGSFVNLEGPAGPPGMDGEDFSAFGLTYSHSGTISSSQTSVVNILPDNVLLNNGLYVIHVVMHFIGSHQDNKFSLKRMMDFSLYVTSDESGNKSLTSDLKVSHHSGVHVLMDEMLYPPAPTQVNNLEESLLKTELDTTSQNYKAVLMVRHYLDAFTGSHFNMQYKLQTQYHHIGVIAFQNLLLNSFFSQWIDSSTPLIWTSEHNQRTRSTDSLMGDYSLRIAHSFAYSGGRSDEQPFSDQNASGVSVRYDAEIWVKGHGEIRIGILRPGYTVHDYCPWVAIQTSSWTAITHSSTKDNRTGTEGNFRIQHQRGGHFQNVDLRIDQTKLEPIIQS